MRVRVVAAASVGAVLAVGVAKAADPRDPAAAEALFAAGKSLMDQGDYQKACPKLEESYRLDPATGAVYALALCHEGQGKLATAWSEFLDAAARSSSEGNRAREEAARRHADALEPKLSFLIVRVEPSTARLPDLSITRNGVALRPAAWGTPVPIDPGSHRLRAVAPGHEVWEAIVNIDKPRQREAIDVPVLARDDAHVPPVSSGTAKSSAWMELTPVQFTGVVMGGAGVASLGFAVYASVRALDKKAESNEPGGCDADGCSPEGEQARWAAREAANFATIGAIAGGVLLGAGVALFVLGKEAESEPSAGTVQTSLTLGGVSVRGAF
jgi:tetratricopeptide (TPR) repeat protein